MLTYTQAYSGFSVDDLEKARTFYGGTLGLKVTDSHGMLQLQLNNGAQILVYSKENHTPATFTILNFEVADIEQAVKELKGQGVTFEQYPGMENMGEDGIARQEGGPMIAWFKDPAGNVIAVLQP